MLARLLAAAAVATSFAGAAMAEGHITLDAAFLRSAPPNAPVAGGYVVIANGGEEDDRLVAAGTDAAGRVELHEMVMDGDVMRMREVEGGIPVPAGGTVALRPGGLHLMLMDLAGPMPAGETRDVTLTFESGEEMTAPFVVARQPEIELALEAAGAPADAAMDGADEMDGDGHGDGHGAGGDGGDG